MSTQNKVPLYNSKPIDYSLTPYILTKNQAKHIESTLTELLNKIEKFTSLLTQKQRKKLKLLGLPLNLDASCTALGLHIPFARFDFTFNKRTHEISVFELNTDGTSGWNVIDWLGEQAGIPHTENPNYKLTKRLYEGLRAHHPSAEEILLLDFNNVMTEDEQRDLCSRWGIEKKTPQDRDWKKHEGALVYRRAVSWELRKNKQKCSFFLKMWKDKKITVVGGWSSDVGMSKAWPAFMRTPVVPKTYLLNTATKNKAIKNKEKWILKPIFSHSGRSVVRGKDISKEQWKKIILKSKNHIIQELIELPLDGGLRVELGLYFINGKPSGYMCRSGHKGVITDSTHDVMRPVRILG